ncbi:MAG: cytochrome c peroxidase [Mariniblastus sp.]|nr:cytochrome c peroxidase [Mariniblastus sp.]
MLKTLRFRQNCNSVQTRFIAVSACFVLLTLFTPVALEAKVVNDDDKPILPVDDLPAKISTNKVPMGFKTLPKSPADNPTTEAKAKLGRRLFFDPILSNDQTVSCASCHQPKHGFASPNTVAIGIGGKKGTRNAPTVLNRGYGAAFSWDGRDASLEQQALGPLKSESELGGDVATVIQNVKKDAAYVEAFASVFSESKSDTPEESVTLENIAKAIACFERTLTTGNSKVDRFRNEEYEALTKEARQGLWIFESRGGCWRCHNGPNLADDEFHNTGVGFGMKDRDLGRSKITEDSSHKFQFKTPGLRDVEHTAPYMHDGSVKTLREVVEFYNKGGAPDDPNLDKQMKPLKLTDEEVGFLVEFLKALSGDAVK